MPELGNQKSQNLKQSLIWAGRERFYEVHNPLPRGQAVRVPAIFILHGANANAGYAERMSGMSALADEKKFIAVYPNGTGTYKHAMLTWNAYHCCGYAHEKKIDDVGFLDVLIEKVIHDYPIDEKRIYVAGMSNGAMMAYRLACEIPHKIAAIGAVAGTLSTFSVKPSEGIPVMAFHGKKDEHAPYDGGTGRKTFFPRKDRSVRETIQFWVEQNRCDPVPEIQKEGSVERARYRNPQTGREVVLYTLQEQGHAWPGGQDGLYFGNLDPPSQEISASALLYDFFMSHPKK